MNTKTKQGGLGIVSILTIVFIVLKLSYYFLIKRFK